MPQYDPIWTSYVTPPSLMSRIIYFYMEQRSKKIIHTFGEKYTIWYTYNLNKAVVLACAVRYIQRYYHTRVNLFPAELNSVFNTEL